MPKTCMRKIIKHSWKSYKSYKSHVKQMEIYTILLDKESKFHKNVNYP